MNLFKGMTKGQKKKARKVIKIMSCDLDCEECGKTLQECVKDIRFCLNLLLRKQLKNIKNNINTKEKADSMVS